MEWLVLLSVSLFGLASPTSIPPLPACQELKYTYSSRGVPEYDIPGKPVQGLGLQFCPSGPTCCTARVEERLGAWSERQYRDAIYNRTLNMARELQEKADEIDDYVYVLLNKAQRDFHDVFTRTYGIMYQKNADVFQEYFKNLKIYYDKGVVNPTDSTHSFFSTLYQKMFQVLNFQYTYDNLYLSCVTQNMDELQPFGDVPRKLASSVKRSLVAARALVRALRTGHEIAHQMTAIEPRSNCIAAVKKMSSCPACQGLPEVKPCNGYCINIMKGCLAHHYEIDEIWNTYVESLVGLTDRLIGPFNLEMTIEPISIKISDAIMNFQESGFQVTQKVFEVCGTPRLGRRSAQTTQFVFEKRLEKIHRTPARPVKSQLEVMLTEVKKRVRAASGYWSLLPYQMCDSQMEKKPYRNNLKDRESCWNGQDVGEYAGKVREDGLVNQMENPEVPVSAMSAHTVLTDQKIRLETLASQLRAAYKGLDIEWWDTEDMDDEDEEGSGRRGGGYRGDGGPEDDEDYSSGGVMGSGDREEGSGDYEDEILVPSWTKDRKRTKLDGGSDSGDSPGPLGGVDRDSGRLRVSSGGTSSLHLRSSVTVARAVVTYLLPMVTCYMGGFAAELPLLFS